MLTPGYTETNPQIDLRRKQLKTIT